ncbi:hypothetical protein AXG93_4324s1480 [Marchantia polymorpha subsp. ruderalis]|uniref:Uncharacterized protein n=1 Tax=Marchantia polymorpha subsp. ruderalis TaxID=1480154 RepID=A0A176VZY8_MARPO|nr:hypothetical protein AXG93_4324s1480 [Marchantia polymorpha subsp. ruderalis]
MRERKSYLRRPTTGDTKRNKSQMQPADERTKSGPLIPSRRPSLSRMQQWSERGGKRCQKEEETKASDGGSRTDWGQRTAEGCGLQAKEVGGARERERESERDEMEATAQKDGRRRDRGTAQQSRREERTGQKRREEKRRVEQSSR